MGRIIWETLVLRIPWSQTKYSTLNLGQKGSGSQCNSRMCSGKQLKAQGAVKEKGCSLLMKQETEDSSNIFYVSTGIPMSAGKISIKREACFSIW